MVLSLFERVSQLAKKHGKSLKEVAEDLGLSRNAIYQWRDSSPKADTLNKVADYFDVTTDYLLGRNQTPEWATREEALKLDEILSSNSTMSYGPDEVTEEDREQINLLVAKYYWDKYAKKQRTKKEK